MIKQLTVYETMGVRFDSCEKAIQHRENLIAKFIEKMPGYDDIQAKKRIDMIQYFIDNRFQLMELMDYQDTSEEQSDY